MGRVEGGGWRVEGAFSPSTLHPPPRRRSMIRLAHFSDVHVTARPLDWTRADWFNKRLPGWFNLRCLGRGRRFARTDEVLAALAADLRARRPDHVVFSGDATALGFEAEFARAVALLGV